MTTPRTTHSFPKWLRILLPSALLIIWFGLAGIGGPYFGKIGEVATNDQSSFLPSAAESTKVNEQIEKFRDEDSIPALIVFSDDGRSISDKTLEQIGKTTEPLAKLPDAVGEVAPPILSDDGEAVLVVVNAESSFEESEFLPELKKELTDANLTVDYKIAGPVGLSSELTEAFSGIDGLLLGVALAVVFVILLLVYRSPVLPFLVLFNSIAALSAAILCVYYLADAGIVTINGQVQGILFILVIGAATDYALLFVSRYREELLRFEKPYQALAASWRNSLEPILAAGGTVGVGLLCLTISELKSTQALGPVGAIGIAFSIISALTLLPSLLLMWGRAAFWPRIPRFTTKAKKTKTTHGFWQRIADFVGSHARPVWIVASVILFVATLGLTQLSADGVKQSDLLLGKSDARDGQELLTKHFPGGSGTPTQVLVDADKLTAAVKVLDEDKGVASVAVTSDDSVSGTKPLGKAEAELKTEIRTEVEKELQKQKTELRSQLETQMIGAPQSVIDQAYSAAASNIPSVKKLVNSAYPFADATPREEDGKVLLSVTLENDPDSETAQKTVVRIRDSLDAVSTNALVGGTTAIQYDVLTSSERDRAVVIPVVLAVITIILMLLLRSILAPILLLATTVLSFAATLGISAIVFNDIMHLPGADPSVVLYSFIFLVALGIDYNIFLMTRVREESLRIGTRKGVLLGLVVTGGVITSAGIVLAATFAALSVIPILFLLQIAFVVAFGVLLDTIVVRSLLVPGLVYDIGKYVWWPSKKHKN